MKKKKNRIKNYLKFGVFLFGAVLLLLNCQLEETNYSKNVFTKKINKYSVKKIHYQDLINDLEFQKSLKIIKNKFVNKKQQKNSYSKSTTQINIDLVILTDEVKRVESNNGNITWTFETETPVFDGSDFENFVVKKQNNEFYYYLITYKYNIDALEEGFESIKSYRIREEYLSLNSLNLSSRGDAFDWVYPDDGGGTNENCVEIYTEIEPCSSGGYHTLKYWCQHQNAIHGGANTPPCNYTCSGTTIVTIIDYTGCENGTYDPPNGPNHGNNSADNSNDSQLGGGTNNEDPPGGSTATSPVDFESPECLPANSGKILIDGVCQCPDGYTENDQGICIIDDCNTSKEDLKKIFPSASETILKTLSAVINMKGKDFGINTKEKLQHFLAQAGHETGGMTTLNVTESTYWTTASKLAKTYTKFTLDSVLANSNSNFFYAPLYLRNSSGVANIAMCCKYENGDINSGDGYKYRGRGLFQLTWKENYRKFQEWYNNKYNPDKDFLNNPNLISDNDTLAILSGLWYYKKRVLDNITVNSSTTVAKVTKKINTALKGLADRKDRFQKAKDSITCK